jgi:glycosyltransferase involved in cell wall biosynthesis
LEENARLKRGDSMKILQVTNFFKPSWESGGPARVAYEISKKLIERGHEVTVYTTDGFKSRLDVEKNKTVDVDGIRTYYFRNLSSYLTREVNLPIPYYLPVVARKEIKDFDVIHIHEYRTMLAIVVHHYAEKYGVPYILQARGSIPRFKTKKKLKKLFDIFFGYKILKNASKLIFTTKKELEKGEEVFNMNSDRIEIVPNGIDLSEYDNLPEKGGFRRKYSIRDDEKIILYLGRIHEIKGLDMLVRSFTDLVKELDNVKLIIVGPDDGYASTLKEMVTGLKIDDKVLFTGPIFEKDKLEAYVDADVFILPSKYESFGNVALEACACGTSVIVTNRCGIAEWINNDVGYVVEYDKEELQDALFKILSDDGLRRRFGEEGRRLVREEFSWSTIIKQIEKEYDNVTSRRC